MIRARHCAIASGAPTERERSMNVATVMRRLEHGGFTHDQAAILAEVLDQEVVQKIATKEHVDLVVDRASERLDKYEFMWRARARSNGSAA